MAIKLFVDTNVYLDFLMERGKEWQSAKAIFTLAEKGLIEVYTSSSSLINIMYVMNTHKVDRSGIIANTLAILSYTRLADPDNVTFEIALQSAFKDLEDAIQYHTALDINGIHYFITSNTKDYKHAIDELPVITPGEFISGYNIKDK